MTAHKVCDNCVTGHSAEDSYCVDCGRILRLVRGDDMTPFTFALREHGDGDEEGRLAGTVSIRGGVGEFHWGRWRMSWRHEPDGWKIGSLHPEMIDGRPIGSMGRLRDFAP